MGAGICQWDVIIWLLTYNSIRITLLVGMALFTLAHWVLTELGAECRGLINAETDSKETQQHLSAPL
jgi:hypothetical protein